MGLRINTNVGAIAAQRYLNNNTQAKSKDLEMLSSGSRINKAGDDAAGLAISERLKSHIRSMVQSYRNANDGISLVQVAEGATNEIGNILVRMRELSIQAASDTIGDVERGFINKEVDHLKAEVERISSSTEFNGAKLLDGSVPELEVQVGIHNDPSLDRIRFDSAEQTVTIDSLGIGSVSTESKAAAQENLDTVDAAISSLNERRASFGALQNRLQSTISNIAVLRENTEAANSRIRDTDMAEATTELTRHNILTQANVSMLAQAQMTPQLALKLLG